MQGISIFQQIYAPRVAHVVTGFDGVGHNTHSPYAIGGVVGSVGKMTAIVANDQADTWHIVNLKCGNLFDAVAVLGAFDESEAANMAMRYHGQYFDAVCGDVCESNTGGLQRFLNHPVYMRTNRPVYAEELAKLQDVPSTQAILWDGVQLKSHNGSSKHLLLDMMRCDDDKALLEKMDFVEEESQLDGEIAEYDALVVEAYKLESTVSKLALAMDKATSISTLKVAKQTLSKPKTMRGFGVIQQLVSFELSDGQAVSIIFNVSDSEANASAKMTKDDLLVAWKYKLNSRDITAAVQPNATQNVSLNMIASRIMGLADANSEKFIAAQKKKDAMQTELADTNQQVKDLQGQEQALLQEIADLQKQLDEKAKNNKALEAQNANQENQNIDTPLILTGKELGDFPDTEEGKKALRAAAKAEFEKLLGQWVDCPALNALEGQNTKVEIRKRGIKEFFAFSADKRKLKLASAISQIIKTAKIAPDSWQPNNKTDKKPSTLGYYHLSNSVKLDGDVFNLRVIIEKDNNGLLHYDVIVSDEQAIDVFDGVDNNLLEQPCPDNNSGGSPSIKDSIENEHHPVNVFDSLPSGYVVNLFIEGEPAEVVHVEDAPQEPTANHSELDARVDALDARELGYLGVFLNYSTTDLSKITEKAKQEHPDDLKTALESLDKTMAQEAVRKKIAEIGKQPNRDDALALAVKFTKEMPSEAERIRTELYLAIAQNKWRGIEVKLPQQPPKLKTDAEVLASVKRLQKSFEGTEFRLNISKVNTDYIRGTLIKGAGSSMSSQEFSYFNNKGFDLGYIEYGNQFDFDTFNPILKAIEKWLQGETIPKFYVGTDVNWDMDSISTPLKIKEALDKALAEGLAIASEPVQPASEPPMTNTDRDYLQSIIDGDVDLSNADEIEAKLTDINERLDADLEPLFEQAAEVFAQYGIAQAATN